MRRHISLASQPVTSAAEVCSGTCRRVLLYSSQSPGGLLVCLRDAHRSRRWLKRLHGIIDAVPCCIMLSCYSVEIRHVDGDAG